MGGWLLSAVLLLLVVLLLRSNFVAEKRWRALHYAWTKLAHEYRRLDLSGEWPEIADENLEPHIRFLKTFGVAPLGASRMAIYEEALLERDSDLID